MYCPSCGSDNPEHANNCTSCGGSLSAPPDPRMGHQVSSVGGPVPTYLVPSILVTIFCCQVFGIVAIVFSAIAMGKNSSADYAGAQASAAKAKMWCWLGFGIGLTAIIVYIAFMILMGLAAGAASTP